MTEKRITLRAAHNISSALVLLRAATLGVNRYAGKDVGVAPQKGQSELSQSEQSQNELSSRVQDKTVQVAVSTSEHAGVSTLATAPAVSAASAVSAHDSSAPTEPVVTAKESSTSSAVSTAAQAGSSEVKSSRSNTKPKSQASVSDAATATESHARKSKLEESTPKYENGIRVLPGKPQPASAATPSSASSSATASAATGASVTAKAAKEADAALEANTAKNVSSTVPAKKQSAAKSKARNSTKHKSADPRHTVSPNATHSLAADLSNLLSDDAVIGAPTSSLIRTGGALGVNNQSLEIGSAPVAITPASSTKVSGDKTEVSAVDTATTAASALAASTVVVSNAASSAAASTANSASRVQLTSEDSSKSPELKEKLDATSESHNASGEHSSKAQSSIESQEASSAETLAPQDKHVAVKQSKAPDTKTKDNGSEVAPESDGLLGTPSSSLLEQSGTLDFGQGQNTVLISSSGVGLASVASSGFASSLELTPAVAESSDKDLVLGVETEPLEQSLRINTGNTEAENVDTESSTGLKLTPASVENSTGLTGVETQDAASESPYNAGSSDESADSSGTLVAATVAPVSPAAVAADDVGDSALSSTSPENKVVEKSDEPLELTPASVIPSADLSDAGDSVTAKEGYSKPADAAVAADADMSVPEDEVVAETEETFGAATVGSLELTSASVGAEHDHEAHASSNLTTTPVTASDAAATVAQDNALEELKAQEPEDLGAGAAIPSSNEVEQLVENGSGADDSALVLSPVADAPVQALSSAEDLGSPISAASAADAAATVNAAASVGLDSAFGSLEESVIGAHSSSDLLAGASLGLSSLDLSALSKPLIQPAASGSLGSADGGLLQAQSGSQGQKDGQSGGLVLTPVTSAVK